MARNSPAGGLPALRADWIERRGDTEVIRHDAATPVRRARGGRTVTQMHYARRGEITPEMEFIAVREGLPADFVCAEVARGRAIAQ